MVKKAERNTVLHKDDALAVEQTAIYDDSLLPSADELEKLKQVDPDILGWLKTRTEIEQDARIKFNHDRISILSKNMNHVFIQNVICIFSAFFIILLSILCSAYFVYKGLSVEGTVFGGSTIILSGIIFLRWSKSKHKQGE